MSVLLLLTVFTLAVRFRLIVLLLSVPKFCPTHANQSVRLASLLFPIKEYGLPSLKRIL